MALTVREEIGTVAIRPKPSNRPDRVVACRMPCEQHERLVEVAAATNRSVSELMRESVFGAVEATSEALDAAYSDGVRDAQAGAQRHQLIIEAERDQERQVRARWQQRAEQLELELRITSARLISSVTGVLEHRSNGARGEAVRLWKLLDVAERERMFPAIATAIVESVHATLARASRAEPEQLLPVYGRARWLCDVLSPDPGQADEPDPDAHARAAVAAVALRAAIVVLLGWCSERTRHHLHPRAAQPPVVPEVPSVAAPIGDAVAQQPGGDALEPAQRIRGELQVSASTVPAWSQQPSVVPAKFLEGGAPSQWATSAEAGPEPTYTAYVPSSWRRDESRGGRAGRAHEGPRKTDSREVTGTGTGDVGAILPGVLEEVSAPPTVDIGAVVIEGTEQPVPPGFDRVEQVTEEDRVEPDHPDAG